MTKLTDTRKLYREREKLKRWEKTIADFETERLKKFDEIKRSCRVVPG